MDRADSGRPFRHILSFSVGNHWGEIKDRPRITWPVQRRAGGGLEGDTDKPRSLDLNPVERPRGQLP